MSRATRLFGAIASFIAVFSFFVHAASAQSLVESSGIYADDLIGSFTGDRVWVFIAAALVFSMQIGFLILESGLVRAKNSINVSQKNIGDFMISATLFGVFGFAVMFGFSHSGFFGFSADLFFLENLPDHIIPFFVFQVMFCGTAATIVSGAAAERLRVTAYFLIVAVVSLLIYPVVGHWIWGNVLIPNNAPLLAGQGFYDFAGATVVHSVGAWVALAAVVVLGPRIGRFDEEGNPVRIKGHNTVMATVACLILWIGWIGFNGGSLSPSDPAFPQVIMNTVYAGAAGGVAHLIVSKLREGYYHPRRAGTGVMAGLVGVTAAADVLDLRSAILLAVCCSIVVLFAQIAILRVFKIDDPVGAITTHGAAGAFGSIAFPLLMEGENLTLFDRLAQCGIQAQGVVIVFVWAFGVAYGFCYLLDKIMRRDGGSGIRVPEDHELQGLDSTEHLTTQGTTLLRQSLQEIADSGIGGIEEGHRIEVEKGDESGELCALFNRILDNLRHDYRQRTKERDMQAHVLEEALLKEKETNKAQHEFVAMASHEFRTPLAIIDGTAQRILRRMDKMNEDDVRTRVQKIRATVQRMLDLVESMLSASRIESGHVDISLGSVNLANLVARLCLRQQEISTNHTIVYDVQSLPIAMYGDLKKLDLVFTNLLSNAVKYSPEKTVVEVKGEVREKFAYIHVQDQGMGIPEEDLPKIFERYYRSKGATGISGTGIGLNLVSSLIELHGGSIHVESEVGKGTTFTVRLPIKEPPETEAPSEELVPYTSGDLVSQT